MAERDMMASEGRASRRRMNRYEYENTLRDLFAIPVLEVRDFLPEDRVAFGFNRIGDALDVSHVQIARYMAAAEFALRQAMAPQADRPKPTLQRFYTWDMPGFRKSSAPEIRMTHRIYDMKPQPRVRRGQPGQPPPAAQPMPADDAPHDREKESVAMLTSSYEPSEIQFNRFRPADDGQVSVAFLGL